MHLVTQELLWRYTRLLLFLCSNTPPILQPMDQGLISTFKSYYWRNTFHATIVAIDYDFSDGSGQSQLKALWKRQTILDVFKNICKRGNIFYIFYVKKKRGPNIHTNRNWGAVESIAHGCLRVPRLQLRKWWSRCGGNGKRTRIRSEVWWYYWIASIS